MYLGYYGLDEPPFGITPDTSFAFDGSAHQEALNTLLVAVAGGEGFVKITGEVGAGKTLLCRRFVRLLGPEFVSAYIPNPLLEPRTLLFALADELGVALGKDEDQHALIKSLYRALMEFAGQGRSVVVCIDEAQTMPIESLEALRLLSNLETEKRKLLQFVLFGQPELDEKLADESVRQIRQRITFHYRLGQLGKGELDTYLAHRLRVAGYRGQRLFSPAASRVMYRVSAGTPRLINILAHKALLAVYGEGGAEVRPRHVRAAARDSLGVRRRWNWLWY